MRVIVALAGALILGFLLLAASADRTTVDVDLHPAVAGPRILALAATGDTYLRDGGPNQNQGGESALRIRASGRNRTLVHFEAEDLAAALAGNHLVSAHLELKVQANGGNWGDGRAVDAHRLTAAWRESAATWSCPADSNLGNHQADCAEPWDGGSFEPAATASFVHTNELSGWARFDVTADLEAALAGSLLHGWLLKKTQEGAPGLVDYSSREVCGEEPRLVLEIEAAGPDIEPPRLAITSPSGRFLVNRPQPPLAVSFFDSGSLLDLSSLEILLDGADLTATCTVCSAGASCPSPKLAEGTHTLTARLRDAAGNLASQTLTFDLLLGDSEHRLTLPVVWRTPTSATEPRTKPKAQTPFFASAPRARTARSCASTSKASRTWSTTSTRRPSSSSSRRTATTGGPPVAP